MTHIQIAIDGPSGAGKSTLSRAVARALGIHYVDTGALYRTVGYFAHAAGIVLDENQEDIKRLVPLLKDMTVEVRYEGDVQYVLLNGEDLGDRIRAEHISQYASVASALPEVRAFLLDTQKNIARTYSVIMDGRDIGTVILPDAQVKIFLDAPYEVRARRRVAEQLARGNHVVYEDVLADMIRRDENDRNRKVAPAVAAPDAIHFENSYETFEEAEAALLALIRSTLAEKGITV